MRSRGRPYATGYFLEDGVNAAQVLLPKLIPNGACAREQVDLDSLKSRIAHDPRLMNKLSQYGASLDDVVGITASGGTDVRIFVLG